MDASNVEMGDTPVATKSVTPVTESRRKVREFLTKYRTQGLPNAKKFRKAAKVARLNQEADMLHTMFSDLAERIACALLVLDKMADENNWMTRTVCLGTDEETGESIEDVEVMWVSDDDPLESLRLIRKALDPNCKIPNYTKKGGEIGGHNSEPGDSGSSQSDGSQSAAK